ncbi:hypothetical protein CEXT_300731 [Caerostris extrusa]|uniref:Uncharacterized protein n=1 Tax=Caerostris extrusa TaxID=172846 RepID=A0AAV4VLU3_CAEEX|nr:hypothetical protein CEXT_300731 [Caerostris extrusa]
MSRVMECAIDICPLELPNHHLPPSQNPGCFLLFFPLVPLQYEEITINRDVKSDNNSFWCYFKDCFLVVLFLSMCRICYRIRTEEIKLITDTSIYVICSKKIRF